MKKSDLDIPELTREQLGSGVRGKYYKRMLEERVVVIVKKDPKQKKDSGRGPKVR